jgi:hypothetical protein
MEDDFTKFVTNPFNYFKLLTNLAFMRLINEIFVPMEMDAK